MMQTPALITSKSNRSVMWLASLSQKKYREKEKCFLCEGDKLFQEAIKASAPITHIVLREDRVDLLALAQEYVKVHPQAEILYVSCACFEKICTEKAPQGVIVVLKYLDFLDKLGYNEGNKVKLRENVQSLESEEETDGIIEITYIAE